MSVLKKLSLRMKMMMKMKEETFPKRCATHLYLLRLYRHIFPGTSISKSVNIVVNPHHNSLTDNPSDTLSLLEQIKMFNTALEEHDL